jgi:nucleoside-diphosphate kinase
MERTLVLLKPDALQRGIAGEIISRFEKVGLKIVAARMLQPDYDHYHEHYEGIGTLETRRGKAAFDVTLEMMLMGPVIAMVLEGIGAVEQVRKMVGATEPKSAQPGTIRGDYSHISFAHANAHGVGIANLVHASADEKEAAAEIKHWFSDSDIYEYETVHEKYTQGRVSK